MDVAARQGNVELRSTGQPLRFRSGQAWGLSLHKGLNFRVEKRGRTPYRTHIRLLRIGLRELKCEQQACPRVPVVCGKLSGTCCWV